MTEKRFNVWEQEPIQKTTKTTITQNKRFSTWDCNAMENLLNTFVHDSEKNGQDNTLLTHKECCDLLNELNDENEQLKQFKQSVLAVIDAKIKHYSHKPFSAPVSNPMSVNYDADVDRLARLSELQSLKRNLNEYL